MAILDPIDLLDQASRLIQPPSAGPPLQVDLRRSISSAYYSVFHAVLAAVADEFVGRTYRSSARYAHVYRSIDHGRLRSICNVALANRPQAKVQDDLFAHGFCQDIKEFAERAIILQEARHRADYDPRGLLKTINARAAIAMARAATKSFRQATDDDRKAFLTLLLCQGRRGN